MEKPVAQVHNEIREKKTVYFPRFWVKEYSHSDIKMPKVFFLS